MKIALLADYEHDRVSLFVYLASSLSSAVDDLSKLRPDLFDVDSLFDRFMSWPNHCRPEVSKVEFAAGLVPEHK
ncbi:hypothetical protein [Micromonospora sp. WMMD737]|uniref:hypothetical protein n=1 Tax=Micromonospora sp. WMMD737 TaxID=3404113 RepID=UPI003B963B74